MKTARRQALPRSALMAAMKVEVPEGEHLGMMVYRFTVDPGNRRNLFHVVTTGRGTEPGEYTALAERAAELPDGKLVWMSDVDAERTDHLPALLAMQRLRARRVLVNGLGLGMVIKAALTLPDTERVDVVEIDPRVTALTGPTYTADPRVRLIRADALTQCVCWPQAARWDVAWHDIWPAGDPKFKPQLEELWGAYAGRTRWQGAWAHDAIMDD